MGNSLVAKVVYFWIFIIGGMFVAKLTGLVGNNKDFILFMVVLACFYWGLAFVRSAGKKRKGK
ncbi:MAG: hypothetical protein RR626_05365 [Anaerovoracaceae bacterium]